MADEVKGAETDLLFALKEWRDSGAPAEDVVTAIGALVDAKIEAQKRWVE
jgi:hypothetical protein